MTFSNGIDNGSRHGTAQSLPAAMVTGCIVTLPALLFLSFFVLAARREYYFPMYCMMGLVFLASSFISGTYISYRFASNVSRGRIVFYLFLGLGLSWLISLLTLAILSLTPLCVGQDNGDGNNDVAQCIVQVVLVSLVYSPLALLLLGMASFIASRLLPGKQNGAHT